MNSESIKALGGSMSLDFIGLPSLDCGLKKAFLECLSHAAAVCFEDRGHTPGVIMEVIGGAGPEYSVFWQRVDDEMRRTWADAEKATENGAYGVAMLLMHEIKGMIAIECSQKENGFDYWIGTKGKDSGLFQEKARLEVSGIRMGQPGLVSARVDEKVARLKRYKNPLPAIVTVVEFGAPQAKIVELYGSGY